MKKLYAACVFSITNLYAICADIGAMGCPACAKNTGLHPPRAFAVDASVRAYLHPTAAQHGYLSCRYDASTVSSDRRDEARILYPGRVGARTLRFGDPREAPPSPGSGRQGGRGTP